MGRNRGDLVGVPQNDRGEEVSSDLHCDDEEGFGCDRHDVVRVGLEGGAGGQRVGVVE